MGRECGRKFINEWWKRRTMQQAGHIWCPALVFLADCVKFLALLPPLVVAVALLYSTIVLQLLRVSFTLSRNNKKTRTSSSWMSLTKLKKDFLKFEPASHLGSVFLCSAKSFFKSTQCEKGPGPWNRMRLWLKQLQSMELNTNELLFSTKRDTKHIRPCH